VVNRAALASALDVWAAARERAVTDLSRKAAALSDEGFNGDAAFFTYAARLLSGKAVHERARAAALRDAAESPSEARIGDQRHPKHR